MSFLLLALSLALVLSRRRSMASLFASTASASATSGLRHDQPVEQLLLQVWD